LLVANRTNNDLYNWWIGADNTLHGINLSAATGQTWHNLEMVGTGKFTSNGGTNLLVHNTVNNDLYDWWISPQNTIQGFNLSAMGQTWANLRLVGVGQFDDKTTNNEMLVQNTVDQHLYEWWITPQGQLTGIDLGSIASVELVGTGHYNNNSAFDQMLVHNTFDGHLYQWWINGNQLSGVDLASNLWATVAGSTTPPPVASTSLPSSDSTALLIQSMASVGAGSAAVNSTSPLAAVDLSQQSALAAPINPQLPHV
jgi:hypothetical protein